MKPLLYLPNLLIIGGSSRNVGKTTLALSLVKKYAGSEKITGLKVTSIRPNEEIFHGSHDNLPVKKYQVIEETINTSKKDTAKMLKAGADKVFYIETTDEHLASAFREFLAQNPNTGPIICESRSLRNIVKPGLFVLLKHYDPDNIKPGFAIFEALADITFTIDPGEKTSTGLSERIIWNGYSWQIAG